MDDGFETRERVLPLSACDDLLASLPTARSRAGSRHLLGHPGGHATAVSDALLSLARRHVGPGAAPFRATLFEKSGARNWLVTWHQDATLPLRSKIPEWGPWSTKAGILTAHAPG